MQDFLTYFIFRFTLSRMKHHFFWGRAIKKNVNYFNTHMKDADFSMQKNLKFQFKINRKSLSFARKIPKKQNP